MTNSLRIACIETVAHMQATAEQVDQSEEVRVIIEKISTYLEKLKEIFETVDNPQELAPEKEQAIKVIYTSLRNERDLFANLIHKTQNLSRHFSELGT